VKLAADAKQSVMDVVLAASVPVVVLSVSTIQNVGSDLFINSNSILRQMETVVVTTKLLIVLKIV
jgi:hypothetical protein